MIETKLQANGDTIVVARCPCCAEYMRYVHRAATNLVHNLDDDKLIGKFAYDDFIRDLAFGILQAESDISDVERIH